MLDPSDNLRLSSAILSRLDELRRLLRRYVTLQGTLMIVLWLLLTFWLGGLVDYLPVTVGSSESPRALRVGLLVVMAAGSVWIAWHWIVVRLLGTPANRSLALLLERKHPELNNELITAVELSDRELGPISNPAAHRAMLERVHSSATARIAAVRPQDMFNWRPLWGAGLATLCAVLITLIAAVSLPEWMELWSRRLFTLTDDPWPRRAMLRVDGLQLQVPAFSTQLAAERVWLPFVDGVARVPQGAAPMLQVSAGAKASQIPEICTLYYRADDGSRGRANLRRVGGPRDDWQPFTIDGPPLDGLTQNIHLDVVGLDARLRDLTIEVVQPAVLAEMQLVCTYPPYLLDSLSVRAAQETLEYRSGLFIPEGTEVTLSGTASGPLSRVDYLIHGPVSLDTASPNTAAEEGLAQSAGEADQVRSLKCSDATFQIPLGKVANSQVVEVRLIDQFGLSSAQIPRYSIAVRGDTIPEVTSQLEGIGLGITPTAMLPIVGTVVDDHGVRAVHAELVVNEGQTIALPIDLNEEQLKSTIDLDKLQQQGAVKLQPGATLGLVVAAEDYYDLGGQPHVGRGQPLQLSVVTPDQLLVMLDRQELELRQRLELIIAELEQLREVLQTLKNDLPQAAAQSEGRSQNNAWVVVQQETARETPAEQTQRLAGLWAQQSVLQADKSQQELSSVAARVENLRQQLVNNRVDSYDRQERLLSKVGLPLRELLDSEYRVLQRTLADLQAATLAAGSVQTNAQPRVQPNAQSSATQSSAALDTVLVKLDQIKSNMQDIEDFNEIVDLVRGLLDDQEKILSETEQEQRQRILDLLK